MVVVANYTFRSSFFYRTLHLEGEEVFGFAKQPIDYPPSVDNDYHHFDHVDFSHLRVTILIVQPNVVGNEGMQQLPCCSSVWLPLVSRGGLKLKENVCVDGQWQIECYAPNFVVRCFALQKTTRFKCKTNINLYNGTPTQCYSRL
jgi:hypothetical protein